LREASTANMIEDEYSTQPTDIIILLDLFFFPVWINGDLIIASTTLWWIFNSGKYSVW